MGLMDVLKGMQHGPHGQPTPGSPHGQPTPGSAGTGMSPITMAILGLLAYKAMKSFGGEQPDAPSPAGRPPYPPAGSNIPAGGNINVGAPGGTGGGLGDLLKGGLGGLLSGSAAGGVLGGGLNDLVKQFQRRGLGDTANSWIGTGPNKTVAPGDLAKALGTDQINLLTAQTGLSREELLEGLSQHLPRVVDQLTPDGQVPKKIPM
jgi:uncharacterized protein YidB (DUF937 family)